MDANISDLLGGVLSNPDMMNKVKTLLPLVSQMMKSDDQPTASLNTPEQPAINHQPPPSAVSPEASSNPLANENVVAAIHNLISALGNTSSHSQPNQSQNQPAAQAMAQSELAAITTSTEQEIPPTDATPLDTLGAVMDTIGIGSGTMDAAGSVNIEKTLNTLKNVTAVASPENDHRAKLLLSLKPFLKDTRKVKIDTAIKYINAAKILTSFGKNGFV